MGTFVSKGVGTITPDAQGGYHFDMHFNILPTATLRAHLSKSSWNLKVARRLPDFLVVSQ